MGKMIGAAEFKAHCLRIMKEIGRTGEAITVTHRGVPIVEVKPFEAEPKARSKLFFGCLAHPEYKFDVEPEESAYDGPWNAELENDEDDPGTGQ